MGYGSYSVTNRNVRAATAGYYTKSADEIFTNDLHEQMKSVGIEIREARDSAEHPDSKAIIIALDVTGSMGVIPHRLIKSGLPNIMNNILEKGIKDTQVLFLAIGDHKCDKAPLQVGQFESSDELMDKWLEKTWLEGGGGGNDGESYMLAWYFASKHTAIDCFEKRQEKGLLISIGDDKVHREIPGNAIKEIMGNGEFPDILNSVNLLADAQKMYDVHHINMLDWLGSNEKVKNDWKELMGDNIHHAETPEDVINKIADICINKYRTTVKAKVVNKESTKEKEQEIL